MKAKKYLPGEKYGKITIISEGEGYTVPGGQKIRQLNCLCECGNERIINTAQLGNRQSLACLQCLLMMSKSNEITKYLPGEKYGKLTILKEEEGLCKPNGQTVRKVLCICDCGNERIANCQQLGAGEVDMCKSCRQKARRESNFTTTTAKYGEQRKDYRNQNKERYKENGKNYRKQNRDKLNANDTMRRHTDPAYKLRRSVATAIRRAMKGTKNGQACWKYLPYTKEELKAHLESQFEDWMTWENHGRYNAKTWKDDDPSTWTWNIDHIIPQADFYFTSMEDEAFLKCWGLNNLRPLSAKQNQLDGAKRTRHLKRK